MPAKDPVLRRFGENIRTQREAKKVSQETLAAEADLDRAYYGSVERGQRNTTILSAVRIAKALGTTVSALTRGIDG